MTVFIVLMCACLDTCSQDVNNLQKNNLLPKKSMVHAIAVFTRLS